MTTGCVLVLTTLPGSADAPAFAARLVEARLAACVNILPAMDSVYRWMGGIERESEHQLLIKTTVECVEALKLWISELHPYEVPELIVLPIVDGSDGYLGWLKTSTRPA